MKNNKLVWVILIVSLALNTVFAVGFVVSRFWGNDGEKMLQEASMPGKIGARKRMIIEHSIKNFITDSFEDDDLKYISKDIYIEKAYMCPVNDKFCVEAACKIISLKDQIRADENQVLRFKSMLESQPDNQSTQTQIELLQRRVEENREDIATNEQIILNRDTGNDGKFMGYFVRHKFRVKEDRDNWTDFYLRFMVNSNGKLVLYSQNLIAQNAFNYDRTSEVIRSVLATAK